MFGKHNIHIVPLIIAIIVYLLVYPYFIWERMDLMTYASLLLGVFAAINLDVRNRKRAIAFSILFCAYLILSLNRGTRIGGTIINVSLSFIPFIRIDVLKEVYKIFRFLVVATFAISVVSYITVALGVQSPIGSIDPLNELKQFDYLLYRGLVVPTHIEDLGRFCSVYDEPGVVGTLAALLLIVEDFNMRKRGNISILIAGLLSFSLFFYLIIAIYLLYKLPLRYKILTLFLIAISYVFTYENEIAKLYLWDRLQITDSGTISGNNRNTDDLLALWEKTIYTPKILFGYGSKFMEKYYESASIQLFILRDGLIFVALFFMAFLLYAVNVIKSMKHYILFVIIFFATLYQRPGFCNAEFILLFSVYILRYYEQRVSIGRSSML